LSNLYEGVKPSVISFIVCKGEWPLGAEVDLTARLAGYQLF